MGTAVAKKSIDSVGELTGRQKVAVLIMALGEEGSKGLTKHLSPEEVEDISFETISGAGPNGAIVHYRVTHETNRTIVPGDLSKERLESIT